MVVTWVIYRVSVVAVRDDEEEIVDYWTYGVLGVEEKRWINKDKLEPIL